jgi:hypothetical protein
LGGKYRLGAGTGSGLDLLQAIKKEKKTMKKADKRIQWFWVRLE